MGNLSKPTILKKVIATFVLCSATFFALSCFTILGRFNWVESLSLWIFVPNIVVGLLFGFVITILLLISDRIKQRRRRLFSILVNGIVALLGVGVAFVLVGFAVILPRSAWQAAPATPEPIVEFVHVEGTQRSPIVGWLIRGRSGHTYLLVCDGQKCHWQDYVDPIPVALDNDYLRYCQPRTPILWPIILGRIVDVSYYYSCGPEASGYFVSLLLADGTIWHWNQWIGMEMLLDFVCWPIAAILTLVVCSIFTTRKAGIHPKD